MDLCVIHFSLTRQRNPRGIHRGVGHCTSWKDYASYIDLRFRAMFCRKKGTSCVKEFESVCRDLESQKPFPRAELRLADPFFTASVSNL